MKLLAIVALFGLANLSIAQQGVFPDGVLGEVIEQQMQVPSREMVSLGAATINTIPSVVEEVQEVPSTGPIPTLDPFIMNAPISSLGQSIKNSIHNQMANTFLKLGPQMISQAPSPVIPAPLLPPVVPLTTPMLQPSATSLITSELGQPVVTQTVITPSVDPLTGQLTQTVTITKTYQTPIQPVQSANLNVQSKILSALVSNICLITLGFIAIILV